MEEGACSFFIQTPEPGNCREQDRRTCSRQVSCGCRFASLCSTEFGSFCPAPILPGTPLARPEHSDQTPLHSGLLTALLGFSSGLPWRAVLEPRWSFLERDRGEGGVSLKEGSGSSLGSARAAAQGRGCLSGTEGADTEAGPRPRDLPGNRELTLVFVPSGASASDGQEVPVPFLHLLG